MGNQQYWAIRRKADGKLMPLTKKPSQAVFEDDGPPRLFLSVAGAKTSMRMWCQGRWRVGLEWESINEFGEGFYYQGLPEPIEGTARNPETVEVVSVWLRVET